MGAGTPIQWCDDTVNPVSGCNGCELYKLDKDNPENDIRKCYAGVYTEAKKGLSGFKDNFTQDFLQPKLFPERVTESACRGDLAGKDRAKKPWLSGAKRLIFVSDMGDALSAKNAIDENDNPIGGGVPFEYLYKEIVVQGALSEKGARHCWLWLTKYPGRMAEFSEWIKREKNQDWPSNLWAGTSVTSSTTLSRARDCARVGGPETTHFLSIEPLWGEIAKNARDVLAGVDTKRWWILLGGESQQKQEEVAEFKLEWARELLAAAHSMGIPVFVKQLGARATLGGAPFPTRNSHGGNWWEWPADLRVRQLPNTAYPSDIARRAPARKEKETAENRKRASIAPGARSEARAEWTLERI